MRYTECTPTPSISATWAALSSGDNLVFLLVFFWRMRNPETHNSCSSQKQRAAVSGFLRRHDGRNGLLVPGTWPGRFAAAVLTYSKYNCRSPASNKKSQLIPVAMPGASHLATSRILLRISRERVGRGPLDFDRRTRRPQDDHLEEPFHDQILARIQLGQCGVDLANGRPWVLRVGVLETPNQTCQCHGGASSLASVLADIRDDLLLQVHFWPSCRVRP